ncbi:hypothetical protein M501DRAFT_929717 [Patellaria atrata CBS 101060]|uniref:Methyltransferase domain-containing protein n=1 Tax=Patellaria atrata CBS 101060 TaxID=1346257 RepID=A0A9P4SF83_9PEZI|nr:hypothetical protein M501DRAFT_929717 [Patellaria atrata CBS 101060]
MTPQQTLPLPREFDDVDTYVESLLAFGTSSELLQRLCGGVHILDFLTRSPDLYSQVLPQEWREWFQSQDIMELLDLMMRDDLSKYGHKSPGNGHTNNPGPPTDSRFEPPPKSLIEYIKQIREHSLDRTFPPKRGNVSSNENIPLPTMSRNISLGMKVKKVHEVDNFARYVSTLAADLEKTKGRRITHLVDFGSGQNYLGRALANKPYDKHIIAVESKQQNIAGAMYIDVLARLAPKPVIMRNKKAFRAEAGDKAKKWKRSDDCCTPEVKEAASNGVERSVEPWRSKIEHASKKMDRAGERHDNRASLKVSSDSRGSIQYVIHKLQDGNLAPVVEQIIDDTAIESEVSKRQLSNNSTLENETLTFLTPPKAMKPSLMVISLHSCGNLLHHGLRSLVLNPAVSAVAMVGCCYNLVTERLGPPTYKLPSLRPAHPRLEETANAFDPHGFPMSEHLVNYQHSHGKGVRLNITARMMAVQAPQNWGRDDSEKFFTRHFFRALLQRIFLDRGVVSIPNELDIAKGASPSGFSGGSDPIIIGTMKKFCYSDFVSYVRGALEKLYSNSEKKPFLKSKMEGLTDDEIRGYEQRYGARKKELSIVWSLMAFSAGVLESMIVVDRWLWLKEQKEVETAWVEPVFKYSHSPRNLVVVGVKK